VVVVLPFGSVTNPTAEFVLRSVRDQLTDSFLSAQIAVHVQTSSALTGAAITFSALPALAETPDFIDLDALARQVA
jgi:type IV pilus biogenesis protein CpaD/CtpE